MKENVQMSGCESIETEDDGLYLPDVGDWGEKKYALLSAYAQVFATSMKNKWDERVYIDLFAGAGKALMRDSGKVVLSSALLALGVRDRFDRYILCDQNPDCIRALRQRIQATAPGANVSFVTSDVNTSLEQIEALMPRYSKEHTVLSFCFVDPCNLGNLQFPTIRRLAKKRMDFMVHLPAADPRRNTERYAGERDNVDRFLGDKRWRAEWEKLKSTSITFDYFVADQFARRMEGIGYRDGSISESVLIRSTARNLRLYRLAFFSKHQRGEEFWKEIKACTEEQLVLPFTGHGAKE